MACEWLRYLTRELWKDEWDKELTRFLTPRMWGVLAMRARGCDCSLSLSPGGRAVIGPPARDASSHFRVTWPRLIIHQMHHDATHHVCRKLLKRERRESGGCKWWNIAGPLDSWSRFRENYPHICWKRGVNLLSLRRCRGLCARPKILWLLCARRVAAAETNFALGPSVADYQTEDRQQPVRQRVQGLLQAYWIWKVS